MSLHNKEQVIEDLKNILDNKATGLDEIETKPLKGSAQLMSSLLLSLTFTMLASQGGAFPTNFKRAKLTPVHKRDSLYDRNNCYFANYIQTSRERYF